MDDASHHNSPDFVHHDVPENRTKVRNVSFGFGALCLLLAVVIAGLAYRLNQQNDLLAGVQAQLAQAQSEASGTKSSLTQANSRAGGLQGQLDNSQRQIIDLQAQIKKAGDTGTSLQAELEKARADLQAQQQTAGKKTTDLQAQLTEASTATAGLRNELIAARKETETVKSQLATVRADMAKAQTPSAPLVIARSLPVTSEFKKSFFGSALTLEIKNTGSEPLHLNLAITGSDNPSPTAATVGAGDTFRLRSVTPGAHINITSDGFQPVTLTAQ